MYELAAVSSDRGDEMMTRMPLAKRVTSMCRVTCKSVHLCGVGIGEWGVGSEEEKYDWPVKRKAAREKWLRNTEYTEDKTRKTPPDDPPRPTCWRG
jgi:hypothetical protein